MVFDVSPQISEKNMFTINLSFQMEKTTDQYKCKKYTENQHKHH